MNVRNGRIFGCNGRIFGYMRMPAGISFHVKRRIIAPFLPIFAHFTPILTPCTLLTTIVPLFDLIDLVKVIDATIFLGVPCAENTTRLSRRVCAYRVPGAPSLICQNQGPGPRAGGGGGEACSSRQEKGAPVGCLLAIFCTKRVCGSPRLGFPDRASARLLAWRAAPGAGCHSPPEGAGPRAGVE